MEELKQLIKDEKVILHEVDTHMQDLRRVLADLKDLKGAFTSFFERQDRFMKMMEGLVKDD